MVALRQRESMAMADSNQRQEKRSITALGVLKNVAVSGVA